MAYRIAEGELTLAAEWRDQSINVLMPKNARVPGANLVIARDRVPLGMTFADYLAQQRHSFTSHLAGCEMLADSPGTVDGREAQFLELSWRSDGKPVHQVMAIALAGGDAVLTFTGSIPGGRDDETRDALIAAIRSFTFALSPTA